MMNYIKFEKEGIRSSVMFSTLIDVVEGMKYNTKKDALDAVKLLYNAKIEETKVICEKVGSLSNDIFELETEAKFLTDMINEYEESRDEIDEYVILARDNLIGMTDMKRKEFNDIIHNFVRETNVLEGISELVQKIDFDKTGVARTMNFVRFSAMILEKYARNMLPETCNCQHGHFFTDIININMYM